MFSQVFKYYHTIRFLQWVQVKYRLVYLFRKSIGFKKVSLSNILFTDSKSLVNFSPSLPEQDVLFGKNSFQFLNIRHDFNSKIDWNFSAKGKLWTYNLNYFQFLNQEGISREEGLHLIHDFIDNEDKVEDGMEPYPISLRAIYWIKFIIKHQIYDERIDHSLCLQLRSLKANMEYHLLGNHLLENAFSLLFGACYFENDKLFFEARDLLIEQLEEQVLEDGGHFELSPMYHQIMLYRILDCINLLQNNIKESRKILLEILIKKASVMLGWLKEMSFSNGDIPLVNDTVIGIAPDYKSLWNYAQRLGVPFQAIKLGDSGYRKVVKEKYELLMDVGQIGPDYIPGHAHSDTFNFILYHKGNPIIVDTGASTYEKNERRNFERSTAAHNTVEIEGQEQSEMWGGFRVARRAKVFYLKESANQILAAHDGYQRIRSRHQRCFRTNERSIDIIDIISRGKTAKAYFHFHPSLKVQLSENRIEGKFGKIEFKDHIDIHLETYELAIGFNQTRTSVKAAVTFKENLHTKIVLS